MQDYLIVTNNPKILEAYGNRFEVAYEEEDYLSVLLRVRDAIHIGCHLMTHPMCGSLKPNQTPYKSVMLLQSEKGEVNDVLMIENSIAAYYKFTAGRTTPAWTPKVRNDFATIDLSLIASAVGNPMISRM